MLKLMHRLWSLKKLVGTPSTDERGEERLHRFSTFSMAVAMSLKMPSCYRGAPSSGTLPRPAFLGFVSWAPGGNGRPSLLHARGTIRGAEKRGLPLTGANGDS